MCGTEIGLPTAGATWVTRALNASGSEGPDNGMQRCCRRWAGS